MFLLAGLAACAGGNRAAAPKGTAVPLATYVPEGPPKLTLLTVVNNSSGSGGHTALLITGSEQIIFDPAGSFRHPDLSEKGDVLYGMSPAWVTAYKSAHARSTYHVVSQEMTVTPAQAEQALQLAKSNGAVGAVFCTNATTQLLRQIPGFENTRVTFYPNKLMEQIAARPGVKTDRYYENDAGDVVDGIVPVAG